MDSLTLDLDKGLQQLLARTLGNENRIVYPLTRRASIKDIIESLHIPHTEVGAIVLNGAEKPFHHIPAAGEHLVLYSFPAGTDVTRPTVLRPEPLTACTFMVDINVGKLARLLRMAGIDTRYDPQQSEADLALHAVADNRILLSRNRDLLRRKIITWAHLVRAEQPEEQLLEVITLFGLQEMIRPFSRCLECNTMLEPVRKSAVLHRLEPLTRKYYHIFRRCPDCDRIYWQGSHQQHMGETMEQVLSTMHKE